MNTHIYVFNYLFSCLCARILSLRLVTSHCIEITMPKVLPMPYLFMKTDLLINIRVALGDQCRFCYKWNVKQELPFSPFFAGISGTNSLHSLWWKTKGIFPKKDVHVCKFIFATCTNKLSASGRPIFIQYALQFLRRKGGETKVVVSDSLCHSGLWLYGKLAEVAFCRRL